MVEHTPSYMTAMQRFYKNHPDELSRAHRAHLGGLGLSEEAQQEMVKRNAPELAHAKGIEAIGGLPKSEHAKAGTGATTKKWTWLLAPGRSAPRGIRDTASNRDIKWAASPRYNFRPWQWLVNNEVQQFFGDNSQTCDERAACYVSTS